MRGTNYFRYLNDPKFSNIRSYIREKTISLSSEDDKTKFRNGCKELANYLLMNKSPPYYYASEKVRWDATLKDWLNSHYKKLNRHGGCPVVMNKNDMQILELKYAEKDFCEKRSAYLSEIKQLKRRYSNTCDNKYLQKCKEYNDWINEMKNYFETRSNTIKHCYSKEPIKRRGKPKEPLCHILEEETFKKPSDCLSMDQIQTCKNLEEKKKEILQGDQKTDEAPPKPEDPSEQVVQTLQGEETQSAPNPRDKSKEAEAMLTNQGPIELTTTKANDNDTVLPGVIISPNSDSKMSPEVQPPEKHALNAELSIVPLRYANSPETPKISSPLANSSNTYTSSILISFIDMFLFSLFIKYALIGLFKKKKKIKRRPVKFLRILNPLLSWKKSEFLAHDHLKNLKYDREKTIKNIIINEHNMNNKVHVSNRKKDRYKTIIEVHMEVLEEYRNTKWEYKKEEFLEICLEMLAKEEYTVYTNLTNDELIIEDDKTVSCKEKQKIIWNKWIERHRNLSEKLKKVHCFNNLKNDWKRELANLKKREELKNDPDEIQNIPFSQREKDIWRQWISEKCIIIKQYIEQDLLNYLTDELQIIPDDYDNEKIKDS
ncbi:STP1 protein, partial [Plasmodium malariae]